MPSEKVEEARVRRAARRRAMRLCKSRSRRPDDPEFGRYHVVDHRNMVVFGCDGRQFDATLAEVDGFLAEGPPARP
jgi:hypothetical protein